MSNKSPIGSPKTKKQTLPPHVQATKDESMSEGDAAAATPAGAREEEEEEGEAMAQ